MAISAPENSAYPRIGRIFAGKTTALGFALLESVAPTLNGQGERADKLAWVLVSLRPAGRQGDANMRSGRWA
jgi:hypothetical protein